MSERYELIKKIEDIAKQDIERMAAKGYDHIEPTAFGNTVDILKDAMQMKYFMAEIEKACLETEYMKNIKIPNKIREGELTEKMIESADRESESEMMGYSRYGYRGRGADGRFVSRSGRGRSAGYTPYLRMMPGMGEYEDMYDDMYPEMMGYRMGYSDGSRNSRGYSGGGNFGGGNSGGNSGRGGYSGSSNGGGNSGGSSNSGGSRGGSSGRSGYGDGMGYGSGYGYSGGNSSRYGESYDRYSDRRKNYHDMKDAQSKQMMEESIGEVFDDMENIVQDVAKEMSPEQKQKYKTRMTQMIQKMQ